MAVVGSAPVRKSSGPAGCRSKYRNRKPSPEIGLISARVLHADGSLLMEAVTPEFIRDDILDEYFNFSRQIRNYSFAYGAKSREIGDRWNYEQFCTKLTPEVNRIFLAVNGSLNSELSPQFGRKVADQH